MKLDIDDSPSPTQPILGLGLIASNLDFEQTQNPFTVYLEVTDNWSTTVVSVPITVTITDINEIENIKSLRQGIQIS